jgi:outer membrane protein OmpA-like peptidoglycan-associated protein
MPGAADATMPPQAIADAVERGLHQDGQYGRQWPPIISLSEAGGYNFKTGSAELSPVFQQELRASIADRIAALVKQYDVDVIEVVGHTDEQPHGERQSNLDYDLLPVLRNQVNIASLVPADNAGLGLARAVSVITVLRQNRALAGYRLIPLSGAQLIRTDETLDLGGAPGDDRERRRIEIRLRKSVPHEPAVNPTLARNPIIPPDRKIARPPRPYFPMRVPY